MKEKLNTNLNITEKFNKKFALAQFKENLATFKPEQFHELLQTLDSYNYHVKDLNNTKAKERLSAVLDLIIVICFLYILFNLDGSSSPETLILSFISLLSAITINVLNHDQLVRHKRKLKNLIEVEETFLVGNLIEGYNLAPQETLLKPREMINELTTYVSTYFYSDLEDTTFKNKTESDSSLTNNLAAEDEEDNDELITIERLVDQNTASADTA